jgi:thioredoxin-related protein
MRLLFLVFCFILANPISYAQDNPVIVYDLLDAIAMSEESNKQILAIFTADWCKYCDIMRQDMVDNRIGKGMIVAYIDIDKHPDVAKEYMVRTIPDYFIMKDRIEIKRQVGYNGYKKFIRWFNE